MNEVINEVIINDDISSNNISNLLKGKVYHSSEPSDTSGTGSETDNEPKSSSSDNEYSPDKYDILFCNKGKKKIKYKKLSYNDVCRQITKYYEPDVVHKYSSALDILASYLKGQKIIYMEARSYKEGLLNSLMLPAIFLSALVSVLQSTLNCEPTGELVLSSISGFIAFLL